MFRVDRIAFGLAYTLRHLAYDVPRGIGRAFSLVYSCLKC
jgi:hypothetical protein